jgi:uncharacterized protein YndB with AHSA1/START domain
MKAAKSTEGVRTTDRDIIITRQFDAPRDLLWKVWTEPAHVEKWWGPEGFSTKVNELDLKPGGRSSYVMIGPDGTEYPGNGVFKEIVEGQSFTTTDEFGEEFDSKGADLPQGMVLTVTFEDLGDRTGVTLHIAHPTPEDRKKHEEMGVIDGWNSSLDCLERYLADLQK